MVFFSSKPVMLLIFVLNRSASVRGVHRHQAIVILAYHISCENLCPLHGTTMRDANFVRTATARTDYRAFFESISTTVFSGGLPPAIIATTQSKIGIKIISASGRGI